MSLVRLRYPFIVLTVKIFPKFVVGKTLVKYIDVGMKLMLNYHELRQSF